MRDALIFAGLTIGGVAALFSSGAPVIEKPKPVALAPVPAASESPAPTPSGSTELIRAADGHFYAGVSVGGHPVTMLVDTGASVIALTGADAREAGLAWNPVQLGVVARGANGPIRGIALTLERVSLGTHEAHNVPAVIIPEGLPVSLLGQSFLETIEPVRIEKDRMVLGKPD